MIIKVKRTSLAAVSAICGLATCIASIATDYWVEINYPFSPFLGHYGLWTICACVEDFDCGCSDILEAADRFDLNLSEWFKATQASACLMSIFSFGAVVLLCASLASLRIKREFSRSQEIMVAVSIAFMVLTVIWGIIAMAVLGVKYNETDESGDDQFPTLSWSYYLVIATIFFEFFGLWVAKSITWDFFDVKTDSMRSANVV